MRFSILEFFGSSRRRDREEQQRSIEQLRQRQEHVIGDADPLAIGDEAGNNGDAVGFADGDGDGDGDGH